MHDPQTQLPTTTTGRLAWNKGKLTGAVAVNDRSEQLINRALIRAFLLGFGGRQNDPPLTPNLHKAAADLERGEVLPSDRAKGEQR